MWLDRVSEAIGREFPEYSSSYRLILPKKGPWNEKLNGTRGALVYEGKEKLGRRVWGWIRMTYSIAILLLIVGLPGFWLYGWITAS